MCQSAGLSFRWKSPRADCRRTASESRTIADAAAAPNTAHSHVANSGCVLKKAGEGQRMYGAQMGDDASCANQKPTPTPIGTETTRSAMATLNLIWGW
jgi:hypothetical protein